MLLQGWQTRKTRRSRCARCNVTAGMDGLLADTISQEDVRVVEILEKLGEERVTVCGNRFLDAFEDGAVYALRVVRRFQQERRNGPDEDCLANPFRSVFP